MKKKAIGVTKSVYQLVMVLEEGEDVIDFTVFYSFAEILESHHFCPAWDFDGSYYEIQYDAEDCLQVLDFGVRGWKDAGDILTDKEVIELTINIRKKQL